MTNISSLWSRKSKQAFSQSLQNQMPKSNEVSAKFNLLIITQFFPPDYAATGQLIQELARNLGKNNVQVNVFTGQPGYAFEQIQAPSKERKEDVNIQRSKTVQLCSTRIRGKTFNGMIFTLRSAWHIFRNARQNDCVLLTTAPPFLSIIGYFAKLFFGLEYICLIYDLYPDVAVELNIVSEKSLITKFWHKVNTIVWRNSKQLVVLSNTMKDRIIAKNPEISDKISIIHNWADADLIKPITKQENWFACQHGIDRKFTVLYSGNLGRCHDVDTILGAIKLLKDQPVQFVFIGAGANHEICRQTIADLNLNNCIFLPYQDKANLPYSLTACDLALVTIAPGLEGVVAPSKVYGIMAAGKAIAAICEPYSYLRQLIADAKCGASFKNNHSEDLAEFILFLAADTDLAIKMGKAGRNYMKEHFTPQIIANQYCEVLGVTEDQAVR